MTFQEWLETPLREGYPAPRVKERLAELIYRNEGLAVSGWGAMQVGGHYGMMGLNSDEALELSYLGGIVAGFKLVQGKDIEVILTGHMKDEWAKKAAAP